MNIDQENIRAWDNVAELYQASFMDLDLYNDSYDAFCQRIRKPGATVFEIGCGPGNITRYLLRKRPDLDILATDVAPSMIELARKNNPAARFEVMDGRDIGRLDGRFDGIMCGFCLPYLSETDSARLIRDCSLLLNTGGVLYLSAIEGDYGQSGYETGSNPEIRMFVHYYSEEFLHAALEANAFGHIEVLRKPYSRRDGTRSTHLIFIATKK